MPLSLEESRPKVEQRMIPQELARRVGALLSPDNSVEARVIFDRINELVYAGARTPQERALNAQRRGYLNTSALEKIGAEAVVQYHQLREVLDGVERVPVQRRYELQQLERLVVDSGVHGGRGKERDPFTIGLAKELRRQIGKLIKASVSPKSEKRIEIMNQSEVSFSSRDVEEFVALRQSDPQAFKNHLASIFNSIAREPHIHKQYTAASAVLMATVKGVQ